MPFDIKTEALSRHEKLRCAFCGEMRASTTGFFKSASQNSVTRTDKNGIPRMLICKDCAQDFYEYLCKIYKTYDRALFFFCGALDIYYSIDVAAQVRKTLDNRLFILDYLRAMEGNNYAQKVFADSEPLRIKQAREEIGEAGSKERDLTEEDLKNRREILTVFHYDPFESDEVETRRKLYRDLVTMIDPAMTDDLVRQRAAIEIVRSFARIDEWTAALTEMNRDSKSMMRNAKEIQQLITTKAKETDMVTKFSKDHGFAERYATAKSRGAGTLSAIMRDMEEFDYDDGKVNLYDINTSASMQQAADISTAAILKQLALSEADYVDMLKVQREEVIKLNQEVARLQEENRLIYKEITKQDLLKELADELRKKGLSDDEVYRYILEQIKYDDGAVQRSKEELLEKKGKKQ